MYCKIGLFLVCILLTFGVSANAPINLTEIFEKQQQLNQQIQHEKSTPKLLIFISFSMPKESLKAWAKQAHQVGGTLLLRGLYENSIHKTSLRTMEIFGETIESELKVDPESFRKFQIKTVPAVVIISEHQKECQQEPCQLPVFDMISGDISLESALEKITKHGTSQVSQQLTPFYRE